MFRDVRVRWLDRLLGRDRDDAVFAAQPDERAPEADAMPQPLPASMNAGPVMPEGMEDRPGFQRAGPGRLRGTGPDFLRASLRRAFTPSQPMTSPELLAGREKLLRNLIGALEDQQMHVVVYGDRGMGKTSMLHSLSTLAREARYVVHYLSCGEDARFAETFADVAASIPLLYHRGYSPVSQEVEQGRTFAELLPADDITIHALAELFNQLSNTRVLIILDEFDRAPLAFRRSISELIKALSDRAVPMQLVIGGVADNLAELIEHVPSIRRNIFGLMVTGLSPEGIAEMIANGERMSGISFEPDVVAAITSVSCGSPYLVSTLAHHAALAAIARGEEEVTIADFGIGLHRALDEARERVSARSLDLAARAERNGGTDQLGLLAFMVLRRGGKIDPVAEGLTGDRDAGLRDAIKMALDAGLIERIAQDVEERYRFFEESLPTYLWIRYAQEAIGAGAPPPDLTAEDDRAARFQPIDPLTRP